MVLAVMRALNCTEMTTGPDGTCANTALFTFYCGMTHNLGSSRRGELFLIDEIKNSFLLTPPFGKMIFHQMRFEDDH